MDYFFKGWVFPLAHIMRPPGVTIIKVVDSEIDVRFAPVLGWVGMRHFKVGILSQNHHWSMHEVKDMMRQIMGCLVGICPGEVLRLIREYLHIHRLSYYSIHSEQSLMWLESAITTFSDILRDPNGIFVQYKIIPNNGDYEPQRLHYFRHYVQSIREKGALTYSSTDRTEIWHK
jgi:hypothetical protein